MVKTLEGDRYALCEKLFLFPFCCSHQMHRYLAGCFGLISGRHCLERACKKIDAELRETMRKVYKLYSPYRNLYLDKCYGESKRPLGEWMNFSKYKE